MDRFYAMLARFLSEHLLQTDCELELGGVGLSTWFEKFIHVFPCKTPGSYRRDALPEKAE
jgi:hypothetical protein